MKNLIFISGLLACTWCTPALAERNLTLYTVDSSGNPTADPYTSRNLDMNDSGRYIFASGPSQNVRATHGAISGMAIAYTDMLFKSTDYVVSPEFGVLIEDEPNIDVSPDGRYLVLRPGQGRAGLYSSAAAPLYLYDIVGDTLEAIVKSHDGSALTGCAEDWMLHNWSRSSFAYWQNEVIYYSSCDNIVAGDTNGVRDIFVYDIASGTNTLLTQIVNPDSSLDQTNGDSRSPEVDDSGRFVVFASQARNLVANPCATTDYHAYVLDRLNGSYTRLTACTEGQSQAKNLGYGISGDGSIVAVNGAYLANTAPVETLMRLYDPINASTDSVNSYYRGGEISITHNGDVFAYISTAFYNESGVYADDISAYGALMTWNRVTNTFITRADHYFTGLPVSTFHHEEIKISSGGDNVFFAGNSSDFWLETISGENSYHETLSNGFARNYPYVTVRGTHNNWTSFSNMRHFADHSWQAEIVVSAENASFKFDVAGDWSENYGDANGDNIADFFGGNITINGGPGVYSIIFYDDSKTFSITPVAVPVLDSHLSSGSEVAFSCYNGTTSLGQSVYVVGNNSELGNWDPAQAVLLSAANYPTWEGNITVPSNTAVEWKCIKRDEINPAQNLVWQAGGNNVFNSATDTSTAGQF